MRIEPEDKELWSRFRNCERNEMIITKSGRCLFPVLKLRIVEDQNEEENEEEDDDFDFGGSQLISYGLAMERIDQYKWKYREGHWYHLPSNNILHLKIDSGMHVYEPESSPSTWQQIQEEGLNFSKAKLTNRKGSHNNNNNYNNNDNINFKISHHNNQSNNNNNNNYNSNNFFSLSSFGNYVPVVYLCNWSKFLERHGTELSVPMRLSLLFRRFGVNDLLREGSVKKIKIEECSFIAVTHYQNSLITHLKKHNNPHAKGFILSDEGIGRMPSYMTRGKPGRKRHSSTSEATAATAVVKESISEPHSISHDVILASLALEKMSSANIPRSEIVSLSTAPEEVSKPIKWTITEKLKKFWE